MNFTAWAAETQSPPPNCSMLISCNKGNSLFHPDIYAVLPFTYVIVVLACWRDMTLFSGQVSILLLVLAIFERVKPTPKQEVQTALPSLKHR